MNFAGNKNKQDCWRWCIQHLIKPEKFASIHYMHLHIVSFNVPFPADYGGVQDVYYKLQALHKEGVKIILHCFDYGRGPQPELEAYCEKVYYYARKTGFLKQFHYLPYIVASRRDKALITNLLQDNYPILFEGLHCTYFLSDARLHDRVKIYRAVNIEHRYYFNLFKAEKVWRDKLYFLVESIKLYYYEVRLSKATLILAVSPADQQYFAKLHPGSSVECVPNFHPGIDINIKTGKGTYILYHGDLSTPENKKAALWLLREVFSKIQFPCIIAGKQARPGFNTGSKALSAPEDLFPVLIRPKWLPSLPIHISTC